MKIIAFDIDGTTINSLRKVTRETLDTLKDLKKEGILLVPTTGRSLDAIPQAMKALDVCDYAITSNGARITNLRTGEDLKTQLMPVETALKVLNVVSKKQLAVSIHVDGQAFDNSFSQRTFRRVMFHGDFIDNKVIRDMVGYVSTQSCCLEKIQLFSLSKLKLKKLKVDLDKIEGIAYPMSSKRYFEITAEGAEKGHALEYLCDHLDIALEDVCAIGDDSNDISMLKIAGLPIAMGNANDTVKSHAQYITSSSNHEGFTQAMRRYVLKQK